MSSGVTVTGVTKQGKNKRVDCSYLLRYPYVAIAFISWVKCRVCFCAVLLVMFVRAWMYSILGDNYCGSCFVKDFGISLNYAKP